MKMRPCRNLAMLAALSPIRRISSLFMSSAATTTPSLPIPPGMKALLIGEPHASTTLSEIKKLGASRVFVIANRSSRPLIENEGGLMNALENAGLLAAPLSCSIGMGGGEEGLLAAADAAAGAEADCVVTVGGGAVQDAGKLIRLWLSTGPAGPASVPAIQAAQKQEPMPDLPPQIALPNSFAMAEATHVAGLTTSAKTKSGAADKILMPTVVVYDPALSEGLPDWVRFGSALRGVEHAVGAVCHPKADDDIRRRALDGLRRLGDALRDMKEDPESDRAQSECYRANWIAIRALNTGCYPSVGHLVQNHYSARYDVHQGSCSGILCARMLRYHRSASADLQKRISEALGDAETPACRLVADLVATLPGVKREHVDVGVTEVMLREFAQYEYDNHLARLNALCPKPFESVDDVYDMLNFPLEKL